MHTEYGVIEFISIIAKIHDVVGALSCSQERKRAKESLQNWSLTHALVALAARRPSYEKICETDRAHRLSARSRQESVDAQVRILFYHHSGWVAKPVALVNTNVEVR